MRITLCLLFSLNAWAQQNMDISIMAGLFPSSKTTVAGSTIQAYVPAGPNAEVNYGYQILRRSAAELWLETPLLFSYYSRSATIVGASISATSTSVFAFTPGVRVRIPTQSRFSPYAVGGFGYGSFVHFQTSVSGTGTLQASQDFTTRPAFDYGAGIDIRLTRLVSLRAEARDVIPTGGLKAGLARHHVMYQFGIAFHF